MSNWATTDAHREALAKGQCPDCTAAYVDLRGSSASPNTLRFQGRCMSDGMTWSCNKDIRDEKEKRAKLWK